MRECAEIWDRLVGCARRNSAVSGDRPSILSSPLRPVGAGHILPRLLILNSSIVMSHRGALSEESSERSVGHVQGIEVEELPEETNEKAFGACKRLAVKGLVRQERLT